jgi:hypothetical protein
MASVEDIPFPLEDKINKLLDQNTSRPDWQPSGVTRDFYLELSRLIVIPALAWQDKDGQIIDPFTHFASSQQTSRFVGACGGLLQSGKNPDLIDACALSMDKSCADLANANADPGPYEFVVKELMMAYMALRDKVDAKRLGRWKQCLSGYDPEKTYQATLSKLKPGAIHNFCTFGMAGEAFKTHAGLAENEGFIDRHLETQKDLFTAFGMYRDPNDPMTYDWVSRMNLALMMHWGYKGKYADFVQEMLRRGALTGLLYMSTTGEAPFGGRSNQQNFNEVTLALLCEYEARRHARRGNMKLAGVFKRAAHLLVKSVQRWLTMSPVRFTKNEFLPATEHGRQKGYGHYGVYSLLIASQLGMAYMLTDDSIPEAPAFCETGGYALHLPGAFHKIFASCGGYHVEIDTRANLHYDATGLGCLHRAGVPTELGLSIPIPAHPDYIVTGPESTRNAAMGPGWMAPGGKIFWLSDLSDEIAGIEMTGLVESHDRVEWSIAYTINIGGKQQVIRESYALTRSGLHVTSIVPDDSVQTFVQIPLLETSGLKTSRIHQQQRIFAVDFAGHGLRVECLSPDQAEQYIEPFPAPNRNGIYRIGCFKTTARQLSWRAELI